MGNQQKFAFIGKDGKTTELIFLSRKEAENAWKISENGEEALLITDADVLASNGQIELRQFDNPMFNVYVYPQNALANKAAFKKSKASDKIHFARFDFGVKPVILPVSVAIDKEKATLKNFADMPANVSDIALKIKYYGGECLAKNGDAILTDNLFNGDGGWLLGLKRFAHLPSINFEVTKWQDNITSVAPELAEKAKQNGPAIEEIKVIPQYGVRFLK